MVTLCLPEPTPQAWNSFRSRLAASPAEGRGPVPANAVRAMENLKIAVRLRLRRGGIDQAAADKIAAALDAAAQIVEKS